MGTNNSAIVRLLQDLVNARFWGTLTIKFKGGKITHLYKEESLTPEQLAEEPEIDDDRSK